MRRFDATTTDSLWHWANRAFKVGSKERDFVDREGRPHLDSLLASDMLELRHFTGRPEMADLFLELQAYSEQCQHLQRPPSGRWMIHLAHRRYYFDQARGTMFTEQLIYALTLDGYSYAQVQSFYQRVNYARMSLPLDAQPDDFKFGH